MTLLHFAFAALLSAHALKQQPPAQPADTDARRAQALAASQGYLRAVLDDSEHHSAPGQHAAYAELSRRMVERWHPVLSDDPESRRAALRPPPPAGRPPSALAAHGALYATTARPWDPAAQPPVALGDPQNLAPEGPSALVEVAQDTRGRLVAVRVLRSSGLRRFDASAVSAARGAFAAERMRSIPGGRRSRWSFEAAAFRYPMTSAPGFSFDESDGWAVLRYPGGLLHRVRVRPVSGPQLDTAR